MFLLFLALWYVFFQDRFGFSFPSSLNKMSSLGTYGSSRPGAATKTNESIF
jgi:hypothetical protein